MRQLNIKATAARVCVFTTKGRENYAINKYTTGGKVKKQIRVEFYLRMLPEFECPAAVRLQLTDHRLFTERQEPVVGGVRRHTLPARHYFTSNPRGINKIKSLRAAPQYTANQRKQASNAKQTAAAQRFPRRGECPLSACLPSGEWQPRDFKWKGHPSRKSRYPS